MSFLADALRDFTRIFDELGLPYVRGQCRDSVLI